MIEVISINNEPYLNFMPEVELYVVQWSYKNKEYQTQLFFNKESQHITVQNDHVKKNKSGEFCRYSGKIANCKIDKKEQIEKIREQLKNELIKYMS